MTTAQISSTNTASPELERFAYVASHDMAEPLRMVSGYLDLIREEYAGRLDPDFDDFIALAIDGAERMHVYLQDLRTYSRIGRIEDGPRPVDCGDLLQEVLEDLADQVAEARAVVEVAPLPTLTVETEQLKLVFHSLLSNAIKFRAPERAPHVVVTAVPDGECWRISVRDNGIGLEAGQEQRAFDTFERFNGAQYPGTGMGLAIARKVIERHGGRIWLEPAPGAGSVVHLALPTHGATA
jgi:light-regulated signal transduction histidine kinase (bacteriophytochrome)